ncbi:MAG: cardiolipin synthase [Oscillospiraceae bacterium]
MHGTKQKVERRISAALRIGLAALSLLLQIVVILFVTFYAKKYLTAVYLCMELVAICCVIGILDRNGSPSYKLSWTVLILTVPVAGMILYLLWGGNRQAKRLSLKKIRPPVEKECVRKESAANLAQLAQDYPGWERLAAYLGRRGFFLYRNTDTHYFSEGADFFPALIARLSQAEHFIFLEYYILAEGKLWDEIFAVLRERAAAGVEIKIIFDDFGNITRLSGDMLHAIQEAGIEVLIFNPVHRYVNRIYFNYRDHRKIAVIDGQAAYTGGLNIADEYANLVVRFGHWKDTGIHLEGDGAWGFTTQFIHMWERLGGSLDNEHDYYRPRQDGAGAGYCQPMTDGPMNNPDNPAEETYLQLITGAKRTLYITTPYLAIEDSMLKALCIAGDGGVDVRLMLPAIPDKKVVYMVAETYFGELMRHHVKIYRYTPGFLHAKSVAVDGEIGLVGTTNMDYRSFQLHYECAVLLYGASAVGELCDDMDRVIAASERVTMEEWNKRGLLRRLSETLLRLFAVWM